MSALGLFLVLCTSAAAIEFPSYISSSMVIQREKTFILWGLDVSSATVHCRFQDQNYVAAADPTGLFRFELPGQPASTTPSTIGVSSSSGANATLTDVLFGDVFVSSGQSNMELSVAWCYDYKLKVQESAQYGPLVRIAQVAMLPEYPSVTVAQSNLTMQIPWARAGPSNVAGMSAIAYFTAVEMVKANPLVPIGAIASSWGGTAQEPWMPPDAYAACKPSELTAAGQAADMGLRPGLSTAAFLPSGLWNSMIAPLTSLSLSGWYWYQGESNVGQASFAKCFATLIPSWRQHWGLPSTPFIFFQLGPWPSLDSGAIPLQRQAQTYALSVVPHLGMVVAADRGDAAGAFHPIHPPVKEELSKRAFLVTDRLVYGNLSSPLQGPQVLLAEYDPWEPSWEDYHFGTGLGSYVCNPGSGFWCGGVRVTFDQEIQLASTYGDRNSLDNGLVLWDASSNKYQRAEITAVRGSTLQLNTTWTWSAGPPAFLQYGFSDYPNMPIYNSFGQPAQQFLANLTAAK